MTKKTIAIFAYRALWLILVPPAIVVLSPFLALWWIDKHAKA